MDLDRSLIDRIYTNLDFNYQHLPKRVIARSTKSMVGFPVYVLPSETVKEKVKKATFDFDYVTAAEEEPYGAPSNVIKQANQPILTAATGSLTTRPPTSGEFQEGEGNGSQTESTCDKIDDGRTLSFDGNIREKIIMSIVAAVLIFYLYFKFLH